MQIELKLLQSPGRHHVHLRDPRPGRGALDERPHRGHARRARRAARRPRHDLRPPAVGVRRRASSASRTSSTARRRRGAARRRRRRVDDPSRPGADDAVDGRPALAAVRPEAVMLSGRSPSGRRERGPRARSPASRTWATSSSSWSLTPGRKEIAAPARPAASPPARRRGAGVVPWERRSHAGLRCRPGRRRPRGSRAVIAVPVQPT